MVRLIDKSVVSRAAISFECFAVKIAPTYNAFNAFNLL